MKADVTARLVMTTKIHPSEDQNKALHSLCKDKDTRCAGAQTAHRLTQDYTSSPEGLF